MVFPPNCFRIYRKRNKTRVRAKNAGRVIKTIKRIVAIPQCVPNRLVACNCNKLPRFSEEQSSPANTRTDHPPSNMVSISRSASSSVLA
eukprot:3604564-Amphidinium_carterae.1